ncbi:MAG: hypothetical protein VYC34_04435, partial [Planctomycetota bacterium]|nr:hypothetical protein [Planctomycetota bacterium]
TLRDVHIIEASLVKQLCSIYHGRIAYPTAQPEPARGGSGGGGGGGEKGQPPQAPAVANKA